MTKNTKKRNIRKKPASNPSSSTPVDGAPVVAKLMSISPDDRAWAAAAISNLVSDKPSLDILLSHNVIGCLIESLKAPPVSVQIEVAGALRNIAMFGQDSVGSEMYHKGILDPLFEFIPIVCLFNIDY